MPNIAKYSEQTFDDIRHINENGQEFWYARELQHVLEYTEWRNFSKAIDRAMTSCKSSGNVVLDHFVEVNKMVSAGVAPKSIDDFMLSRYACYLIVMNGDPRKEVIAVAQTYFAVKTRQQELIEHYDDLSENQKRLAIRNEMVAHNKSLAEAAQMAGVVEPRDYAIFQNKGYQGLYGGLGAKDIHKRKGLKRARKFFRPYGQYKSWQQTCSVQLRLMKNCGVKIYVVRKMLTKRIIRSAKKFVKQ